MMTIETQLLHIRQKRYEQAQQHVAHAKQAWQLAVSALHQAETDVKNFIIFKKKEIQNLYEKIIRKKIKRRDLQNVRLSESNLHEKLGQLRSIVKEKTTEVKKKKQLLDEAHKKLITSQKGVAKAEEIYNQSKEKLLLTEQFAENDRLDEFAVTGFFRKTSQAAILSLVLGISLSSFTPNAPAEEKIYYRALNQNLPLIFQDIADYANLKLEMFDVPNRRIKGEYIMDDYQALLTQLTERYQLDWFIQNKKLYLTSRDNRKQRAFTLDNAYQMRTFYHRLIHSKDVKGTSFPITQDSRQNQLIITAPEIYLRYTADLYQQYLKGDLEDNLIPTQTNKGLFKNPATSESVMVFHLKHAWAADKTYNFSNNSYAVPGIATLLRKLTGAKGELENEKATPTAPSATPASGQSLPALNPLAAPRRQQQAEQQNQSAQNPQNNNAQENIPQAKQVILADERLNAVLIYDHQNRYDYYKELINHLDRKAGLVEIEAMIVDIAKNHMNDLGIDWSASKGNTAIGFGSTEGNLVSENTIGLSAGAGGLTTALAANLSGVLARIKFLETKGESRIISQPSVVTMNNLEAVINTTQRFFVRVTGFQDSSLYPVEAGTTLRVTPHIIPPKNKVEQQPHIQLFVSIEDGAIDQSQSAMVDGVPSVQENKVSTQAVVEQGESLLIGGHIHTTKADSSSNVPLLGKIPLIGYLFRSENTIKKEFIRLFIIRPRIYG